MDLFKLRDFAAGAGIDVGAGPDSLAVAVVQDDASRMEQQATD